METTFEKIMRKTGRKPSDCKCNLCKSQCRHPCLGTPEDIIKIIEAGYANRLRVTDWYAGVMIGVTSHSIDMIQPFYDEEKDACTFFTNGLCELHDHGLKPTEGKLSHHSTAPENFNPHKSLAWNVAKEWLNPAKVMEVVDAYNEPEIKKTVSKMSEFNIEHQYQIYLQRMALTESEMHPEQGRQLRQTFFGACGQLLILLRDDLSELDEDKAIETMGDMMNQVGDFFLSETNKRN